MINLRYMSAFSKTNQNEGSIQGAREFISSAGIFDYGCRKRRRNLSYEKHDGRRRRKRRYLSYERYQVREEHVRMYAAHTVSYGK